MTLYFRPYQLGVQAISDRVHVSGQTDMVAGY